MSQQPEQQPSGGGEPPPQPKQPHRFRRWLLAIVIGLVVLACLGGGFLVFAEHYTAQPTFCASCHNMEPYYASWKQDTHGGHLNIACVDCHYAPGERTTINAKMRGLSQVASYFSGRYGKSRPRAHVAPESCLTSNCHGDGRFLDKPLQVGTVTFKHSKHIKHSDEEEQKHELRFAALTKELETKLGPERFAQLKNAAREIGLAEARTDAMERLCLTWNVSVDRALLMELYQLTHRAVRIAQLHSLQCIDCHANASQGPTSVAAPGQSHFRVQKTSCYTCHFNSQAFNVGTAECMRCHTPPQKAITVHDQIPKQGAADEKSEKKAEEKPKTAEKAIKMDHSEIVAHKVDCRACHADVIVGNSLVTRRDCEHCHDQPEVLASWKTTLTTDDVIHFHKVHVPQQRAKCLDCHSEIRHQLAPVEGQLAGTGFLSSAMSDCTHCHSSQHRDVVKLLLGRGSETVPSSDPNVMFGARTNCYGCHTEHGKSGGKDALVATQQSCVACHGEQYGQTFEQWKTALDASLTDAQDAVKKAEEAVTNAKDVPPAARSKAEGLLAGAKADLELIQRGNGVHNITYALDILGGVSARCGESEQALAPSGDEKPAEEKMENAPEEKPEAMPEPAPEEKPATAPGPK